MVGVIEMRALREEISMYAAAFDAALVDGYDADKILHDAVAAKNMLAGIEALAAKRVDETNVYKRDGHHSGADHLAKAAGTSVAKARQQLETAKRLDDLPKTSEAVRAGELSPEKAALVADAANANPADEGHLLNIARKRSLGELRDECAKTKAAAEPDPDAQRRHARESRRAWERSTVDGVGMIGYNSCLDEKTFIWNVIRGFANEEFANARKEGRRESEEAYLADGLLAMARAAAASRNGDHSETTGEAASGTPTKSPVPTKAIIRIDWDALVRGRVAHGETCDIAGVGPVPVSWVRDLLEQGDPFVTAVLTKGVDVCSVAHLGRRPNAFQLTALEWLQPVCSREGCNRTQRLQWDHRDDWADTHLTPTDGLDGLCQQDHDLKTYDGWALVEGRGKRPMVPPGHPDHPKKPPP